jgi:hypothetical protein
MARSRLVAEEAALVSNSCALQAVLVRTIPSRRRMISDLLPQGDNKSKIIASSRLRGCPRRARGWQLRPSHRDKRHRPPG